MPLITKEFTQQFHTIIRSNRDLLMKRLQPLVANDIITLNKPQGGFFAFLQTDQQNANDLCMSILNKAKVALIPGDSFGPSGAPFLRLCYARNPEILEEGLDRLVRYFM